jgi:hypothetical protein
VLGDANGPPILGFNPVNKYLDCGKKNGYGDSPSACASMEAAVTKMPLWTEQKG